MSMLTTHPDDPRLDVVDAYRRLRDAIAAENRKLPAVDANGVPLDPARRTGTFTDLPTAPDA